MDSMSKRQARIKPIHNHGQKEGVREPGSLVICSREQVGRVGSITEKALTLASGDLPLCPSSAVPNDLLGLEESLISLALRFLPFVT